LGQWHPELVDELYRTSLELEQRGSKKSGVPNAMSRVHQQAGWLESVQGQRCKDSTDAPAGDQADEVIE